MQKKLVAIVERSELPPASRKASLRTSFTDREVNAFFLVHGPGFLPPGLIDPQMFFEGANRVRTRATVDLDLALKSSERSWMDPLAWVGGKVEVTATGNVRGSNGMGQLDIQDATLGGVSVPPSVLQQLVSHYTKSAEDPDGFNINEPFKLPVEARAVEVGRGAATVIQ
jgi:hypothetical protein